MGTLWRERHKLLRFFPTGLISPSNPRRSHPGRVISRRSDRDGMPTDPAGEISNEEHFLRMWHPEPRVESVSKLLWDGFLVIFPWLMWGGIWFVLGILYGWIHFEK